MTVIEGTAQRSAFIDLARCVEPADGAVGRLVERLGPIAVVDRIREGGTGLGHEEGLRARLERADHVPADEQAARVGARIITRGESEWPSQLDDLGAIAPFALWAAGAANLRLLALRSIAVVGARACSAYGEEVARSWSAELATHGWCVLSGGAYGIDAAAHRGALAVGAPTVCVLAGGVDVPYPRAHDALIARIADEGLVVSETAPGEPVRRQRFLSRNRIIAAVTRATLVVEAAERSGTTATARSAQVMNRPVMAVPGPVTSPVSAGCHRMIGDGEAMLVTSAADVVRSLDFGHQGVEVGAAPRVERERDRLGSRERQVLDAFPARGDIDPDDLRARAGLAGAQVWAALGILESAGWVASSGGQWRLVRR